MLTYNDKNCVRRGGTITVTKKESSKGGFHVVSRKITSNDLSFIQNDLLIATIYHLYPWNQGEILVYSKVNIVAWKNGDPTVGSNLQIHAIQLSCSHPGSNIIPSNWIMHLIRRCRFRIRPPSSTSWIVLAICRFLNIRDGCTFDEDFVQFSYELTSRESRTLLSKS